MKVINASYQLINEPSITKKIERIARVCYKSEDKIGEGTDLKMINNLIKRSHFAMLEHASIVLKVSFDVYSYLQSIVATIENDVIKLKAHGLAPVKSYLRFSFDTNKNNEKVYYVSGNVRAWFEFFAITSQMNLLDKQVFDCINKISSNLFKKMSCKESLLTECIIEQVTNFDTMSNESRLLHEDISILFTVDRGVANELVRHRDCSFAQESTRYVNYSLDRFGNEITVIEPCFWINENEKDIILHDYWVNACENTEAMYFQLLKYGATPQQARDVLAISTKTDIVATTNLREWRHIFNLRACDSTGPAHPQIKEVMIPCLKELKPIYDFAFNDLVTADEVMK